MSSFRDFKSELTSARSLFESASYRESLDVFANLLQRPRIRTQAARIFLDLFREQADLLLPSVAVKAIIEVVRLSLDALTASKDRGKARHTSTQVRAILYDTYQIKIPESKSLRVALRSLPVMMLELPGDDLSEANVPVDLGKGSPSEVQGQTQVEEEDYGGSSDEGVGSGGGDGVGGGGGTWDGGELSKRKSDGREVQIRRTPHMDVDASLPFLPQATFGVHVYADKKAARHGEMTGDVVLTGGLTEYKLKVFLTTSSGLTVVGPESQPLIIMISAERSTSADFQVHVYAAGPDFWVQFAANGLPNWHTFPSIATLTLAGKPGQPNNEHGDQ